MGGRGVGGGGGGRGEEWVVEWLRAMVARKLKRARESGGEL